MHPLIACRTHPHTATEGPTLKPLRRYLLSITLIGSVGLTACGNSEDIDTTSEAATSTAAQPVESTKAAPASSSQPTESSTSLPTSTAPVTTAPPAVAPATTSPSAASPLADFEEYSVLQSTLEDLGSLTPTIETDNPNTRVILYANAAGQKVYKSIYVKRNNRLKIIKINGNGPPLFNGAI
ncbi:MAG: hypothetical protein WAW08_03090 [Candidatus Microthrix parvicella]